MKPRHNIIERVSAVAFVGVGLAGLFWPIAIGATAFMPLVKFYVPLFCLMILMLAIGIARLVAAEMFPDTALIVRVTLAGVSALIWTQWAAGLFEAIPIQGVRPGIFHLAAMAYGEMALIYRLTRDCEIKVRAVPLPHAAAL